MREDNTVVHVWKLSLVALVLFLCGCFAINRMSGIPETKELQRNGEPAEATILQIRDTGMTLNNDPVVEFLVEVHPADREMYQAKTKCPISRIDVPQFQPGKVVPVRVDPQHPDRVAIDVYKY